MVLVSGYAFRQKQAVSGARQIVALNIPGDVLDFQNLLLDVADHSVQVLSRAEIAVIPRESMRKLQLSNPAISRAIFHYTLVEASIFREWVLNIGRRSARERVAHFLCEFSLRLDSRLTNPVSSFILPMTQEQIGDAVGLTTVHVNRMLKLLQNEGLITRNNRNIAVHNWMELREVAGFNDRYLHLRYR